MKLEVDFHCSGGTGEHTQLAGGAPILIEVYPSGNAVKGQGAGGADGDAGSTMGTPGLIAKDVLTQRLNLDPHLRQVPSEDCMNFEIFLIDTKSVIYKVISAMDKCAWLEHCKGI